jgi:hypothetical protein
MIHTYLTKLAKNDSPGHILFLTATTLTAKLGLKSHKLDVYFKNLPFPSPKYPSIMPNALHELVSARQAEELQWLQ